MKNVRSLIALAAIAMSGAAAAQSFNPYWESYDVLGAHNQGYKGQGTTITVVDEFRSTAAKYNGKLILNTPQKMTHGQWTSLEADLIAPLADVKTMQFASGAPIQLAPTGLNVINASYGMMAANGLNPANVRLGGTETSMINIAKNGQAVVVKAAGNDSVNMLTRTAAGQQDYLSIALKGAQSAIFVGALNKNGNAASKATIASYSNKAGTDAVIQSQFLMVGVVHTSTGLAGTSFAAPIVSGYAAILGSKFNTATPTAITNRLLTTARTDTILGYNPAVHGRGEASLSRALAPVSIK